MTLKGRKNHYNVKLLSGYGLSVKLKNNHLVLANGYDPFTKEQQKSIIDKYKAGEPVEELVLVEAMDKENTQVSKSIVTTFISPKRLK